MSTKSLTGGAAAEQSLRIGVLGLLKNRVQSPLLHQMAFFHHRHTMGKAAHQGQIVRDQQHGHAGFLLQIGQQLQHLQSQTGVQRGGGFVGQQELGLRSQAMAIMARWR
jgi:hypothetical protein